MKIDNLSHLQFPADALSTRPDKEAGTIAGTQGSANVQAARDSVPEDAAAAPSGVVLQLQGLERDEPVVYSMARKSEPDFVSLAVSAMRNYADEAERIKSSAPQPPLEVESPASKLWGWQKLASRFHFSA